MNNHAWALVRLQAEGMIRKISPGIYELAASASLLLPDQTTAPIIAGQPLPRWASHVVTAANWKNARRWKGEVFTDVDIRSLYQDCGGCCAMTGLPFLETQVGTGRARKPYAPSLDRIDPEQPYLRDNCRLVRVCVNFALNAFGDDVFMEMAEAALAHQRHRAA